MKNNNVNLIDEVIHTEKSRVLVKKIIPILIRWAILGRTNNTYNELIKGIGYDKYSGIGKQLDNVDAVIRHLEKVKGVKLPTLNALVKSKDNGLPSKGFGDIFSSYKTMSDREKKIFVNGLNSEAVEYEHWDWVLKELGLTPLIIDIKDSEEFIRSGKFFGSGGEGMDHKKLKEYIYNYPERIGIDGVVHREMEHILLSGDRLDVYFELEDNSKVAVEIKTASSPDADVLRGLFQCVKYKSILDAEDLVHGKKTPNKAILIIGKELSKENYKVMKTLGVSFCIFGLY